MLITTLISKWPAFLAAFVMPFSVYAQIPATPKTIQSPTAAGLGIYGNIPVSPFTGKPDITMNLYTLVEQDLQIPISLSYDASGVRPDAHPGWVGLNFNLATFSVLRTIKDGPDDCPHHDSRGKLGYVFTAAQLNDENWNSQAGMKAVADNSKLGYDMEPDEYSFNLPGITGKFYWGQDGKFKVLCDRPVQVEWSSNFMDTKPPFTPPTSSHVDVFSVWRNAPSYRLHAKGFIITDEFGTRYEYGGTNANMEYSLDFFAQGSQTWNCNAWYLKSITKPTGQTINFTYERGALVSQMYFSLYQAEYSANGSGLLNAACGSGPALIPPSGPVNGKLISPIYLKEISSDNYKVKFISSQSTELRYDQAIFDTYVNWNNATGIGAGNSRTLNILTYLYPCFYPVTSATCLGTDPPLAELLTALQWRKLDKIQIQNTGGTTLKEYEFTYNNIPTERLMLQKVQEKSGTKVIPPYEFTYFASPGIVLPPYVSSHTDHWGYNNGKWISGADFSIPNFYTSYGTSFRSPGPDSRYVKASVISKIQYPTGGFTEFIFEPHTYSKEVKEARWVGLDTYASDQLAGGLRIRQTRSYDPNVAGTDVVKTYTYVSGFNPVAPNAVLPSSGVLGGKAQYYWPGYQPKPDGDFTYSTDIFSTQSVLPGSENSYGSHIGYSEVVEASSAGGWTVHKFTNFDNGYFDARASGTLQLSTTAYQPCNSTAYQRGKKISEEQYFQNGNRALRTSYQYAPVGNLSDYSARAEKTQLTYLCDGDHRVYEGTAYLIDVRKFLPSQETTTIYDQDSPALYSAATVKNFRYWPNGQLYIVGQPDSRGKEIKTWYQYPPNYNDAIDNEMTAKNMIGTPRSVFTYTGTETAPVALKLQNIDFDLFNGFYLPKKVSSGIGTVIPLTMVPDIDFLSYDTRGNLLTYYERNGTTTRLEYFGTTDAGKVDLLRRRTVSDGTLIAQSTNYDHKTLAGIQSIADPNGKVIYYEYDEFNRLFNIRDTDSGGAVRASYCYNYAGQAVPCTALAPVGSIAATQLFLIADEADGPALPVTLLKFSAVRIEQTALLSWSTTAETNSERFEIERSTDGKSWAKLGSVSARSEGVKLQQYAFTDGKPEKGKASGSGLENLYRLKMFDTDGTFAYSQIRSLSFNEDGKLTLYPNPITIGQKLHVLTSDIDKISSIRIYDPAGTLVHQSGPTKEINTSKLPPGLYVVQVTYTDGSQSTLRVVKQ